MCLGLKTNIHKQENWCLHNETKTVNQYTNFPNIYLRSTFLLLSHIILLLIWFLFVLAHDCLVGFISSNKSYKQTKPREKTFFYKHNAYKNIQAQILETFNL